MERRGERRAKACLMPLVALIILVILCFVFFFMWVFYVLVCPLHGTHPQGQRSRQRFCYFFLLLTSYILWTLFSESYWSSSPQRRTTAEKNGVSVVLHRSVRPSQSHGTMRGSGKPEDVFKWEPWSTLSAVEERAGQLILKGVLGLINMTGDGFIRAEFFPSASSLKWIRTDLLICHRGSSWVIYWFWFFDFDLEIKQQFWYWVHKSITTIDQTSFRGRTDSLGGVSSF